MRLILGFALAFAIGAVCRIGRIPSPAPQAIVGALLVASMSTGYVVTEKWLERQSKTTHHLSQLQSSLHREK
jgi:XapX domain-containing protein